MKRGLGKRVALLTAAAVLTVSSLNVSAKGAEEYFDAGYYAASYKDLRTAFGNEEAALRNHYLRYGIGEGRTASPLFDVRAYRNRYPDLDKAFGDNWAAYYTHYLQYGLREGRSAMASGLVFDAKKYAEKNPDVYAELGDDVVALWEHFCRFGYKEGRWETAYMSRYWGQKPR